MTDFSELKAKAEGVELDKAPWPSAQEWGDNYLLEDADAEFAAAANPATILSLLGQLEAMRVDARRYRELKRQNTCGKNESLVVFIDEGGNLLPVERDKALDKLIDAALATSQEDKENG